MIGSLGLVALPLVWSPCRPSSIREKIRTWPSLVHPLASSNDCGKRRLNFHVIPSPKKASAMTLITLMNENRLRNACVGPRLERWRLGTGAEPRRRDELAREDHKPHYAWGGLYESYDRIWVMGR